MLNETLNSLFYEDENLMKIFLRSPEVGKVSKVRK
jgi:hypothetical protein